MTPCLLFVSQSIDESLTQPRLSDVAQGRIPLSRFVRMRLSIWLYYMSSPRLQEVQAGQLGDTFSARKIGYQPLLFFFFLNNTAPPEISPLPQHAPLPIYRRAPRRDRRAVRADVHEGDLKDARRAGGDLRSVRRDLRQDRRDRRHDVRDARSDRRD